MTFNKDDFVSIHTIWMDVKKKVLYGKEEDSFENLYLLSFNLDLVLQKLTVTLLQNTEYQNILNENGWMYLELMDH